MDPILEGLVTTRDPDGSPHLAPMGPRVSPDGRQLLLRPFPTSRTYRNLKAHGEGVFHVTDDVLLLAKAALGDAIAPPWQPATMLNGFVLRDACRFMEFRVVSLDESGERIEIFAEVVHAESLRDFWGFNRGKHAVIETAILLTRLHLLPRSAIEDEMKKHRIVVEKTGGPAEQDAFAFLESHLANAVPECPP